MTFRVLKEPKTVEDLRDTLYFGIGSITADEVDDILEFIHHNRKLLDEWAKEYLL